MPEQPVEWVVYSPPKSAVFGHRIRAKTNRKAWNRIAEFLQTVDDLAVNPYGPSTLTCYLPPTTDEDVASERISEAEKAFGAPSGRFDGEHQNDKSSVSWHLNPEQILQGVSFALDDDQYPEQGTGPTDFCFSYIFAWPKLATITSEQSVGTRNIFSVSIGKSILGSGILVQPSFQIPFAWDSPEFRTFLLEMELRLPFTPSDNNYRRWLLPTKPTSGGRQRRLDKGWRKQWKQH